MAEIRTYDSRVSPPTKTGEVIDTVSLGLAVDRARLIQAQGIAVAGLFGAAGNLAGQVGDVTMKISALNSQAKLNKRGQDLDEAIYEFGLGFAPQEIVDSTEDQSVISGYRNAADDYQGKGSQITTTSEGRNYAPAAQRWEDWASDPVTGQASERWQAWEESILESHMEGLSPREQEAFEVAARQRLLDVRQKIDEQSLNQAASETIATNYAWANDKLQNPDINDPYFTKNTTEQFGARKANEVALGLTDAASAEVAIAEFNLQMRQAKNSAVMGQIWGGGGYTADYLVDGAPVSKTYEGFDGVLDYTDDMVAAGDMSPNEAMAMVEQAYTTDSRRYVLGGKVQTEASQSFQREFVERMGTADEMTKEEIVRDQRLQAEETRTFRRPGDSSMMNWAIGQTEAEAVPTAKIDYDLWVTPELQNMWENQDVTDSEFDIFLASYRQRGGWGDPNSPEAWKAELHWQNKTRGVEETEASQRATRMLDRYYQPALQELFDKAQSNKKPDAWNEYHRMQGAYERDRAGLSKAFQDAYRADPEHAEAITAEIFDNWSKTMRAQGLSGSDFFAKDGRLNEAEYYQMLAAQGDLMYVSGMPKIAEDQIVREAVEKKALEQRFGFSLAADENGDFIYYGVDQTSSEGQIYYRVQDPETGQPMIVRFNAEVTKTDEYGYPVKGEEFLEVKVGNTGTRADWAPYQMTRATPPEIGLSPIANRIQQEHIAGVPLGALAATYGEEAVSTALEVPMAELEMTPEDRVMRNYNQYRTTSGDEIAPDTVFKWVMDEAASSDIVYPQIWSTIKPAVTPAIKNALDGKRLYNNNGEVRRNIRASAGRILYNYGITGNEWVDYVIRDIYE